MGVVPAAVCRHILLRKRGHQGSAQVRQVLAACRGGGGEGEEDGWDKEEGEDHFGADNKIASHLKSDDPQEVTLARLNSAQHLTELSLAAFLFCGGRWRVGLLAASPSSLTAGPRLPPSPISACHHPSLAPPPSISLRPPAPPPRLGRYAEKGLER